MGYGFAGISWLNSINLCLIPILGPLLFLLYVNDIVSFVNKYKIELFADELYAKHYKMWTKQANQMAVCVFGKKLTWIKLILNI